MTLLEREGRFPLGGSYTQTLRYQVEKIVYQCLLSDDAEEWSMRVEEIKDRGITSCEKVALINQGKEYSWASVAHLIYRLLNREPDDLLKA